MSRSKRYEADMANRPPGPVTTKDAVAAVKTFTAGKFDQTVELVMHLGIDPRQADQALRGSIALPNGIGQTRKVDRLLFLQPYRDDPTTDKRLPTHSATVG